MAEISYPYIMVDSDGIVQNVAMFSDYEEANQVARAVYGDRAFSAEYKYAVRIGDKWENGEFYNVDGEEKKIAAVIPSESEKISALESANNALYEVTKISAFSFSDQQALAAYNLVPNLYPKWDDLVDGTQLTKQEEAKKGTEITKVIGGDGLLYKVATTHKKQSDWAPTQRTAALFTVINEEHDGTIDDPIPWNVNMIAYEGKYYTYADMLYVCIRDSEIALQYTPDQLIGQYFELSV